MSLAPRRDSTRRPATSRDIGWAVLAIALCVVFAATTAVVALLSIDRSARLHPGAPIRLTATPYDGRTHQIRVPGADISLKVGEPVDDIARSLLDVDELEGSDTDRVRAENGARLVVVSWQVRRLDQGLPDTVTTKPISIRLISGDQSFDLGEGSATELLAPGPDDLPDAAAVVPEDDLPSTTVEVTFDGEPQRLNVAQGAVDARVSYAGTQWVTTDCATRQERCHLTAVDAGSAWRPQPRDSLFTVSSLTTSTYDTELGWAGPGKQWATVIVTPPAPDRVVDGQGKDRKVERTGHTKVTLDEAQPTRTSNLGSGRRYDSGAGTATFEVGAAAKPRSLTIHQAQTLDGRATPRTVELGAKVSVGGS